MIHSIVRIFLGLLLVLVGIVGWLLPIVPGWPALIPGLVILSEYIPPLRGVLAWVRRRMGDQDVEKPFRLPPWIQWPLTAFSIAVLAYAGYSLGWGQGRRYFDSEPASCASCHAMAESVRAWRASPHAAKADCVACHYAGSDVLTYRHRAIDAMLHGFQAARAKADAEPSLDAAAIGRVEQACVACHGKPRHANGKDCLPCHRGTGHAR